jgi:hypothetical protein
MTYQSIISKADANLSRCWTNWALRHEGVWGSGCIDPRFLHLGTAPLLPPRGKIPLAHCIGGWVDPRTALNDIKKWLILPGIELLPFRRPTRRQSLYRLSYRGLFEASSGHYSNSEPLVFENDAVRHHQLQVFCFPVLGHSNLCRCSRERREVRWT